MATTSLCFLLLLLSVTSSASEELIRRTTAQSELANYGFPIGLLPTDIRSFSIDRASGEFVVNLGELCKITLPPNNYLATYSTNITGKIIRGRIVDIDGIRVRAFFKWRPIKGIRLIGDELVFDFGITTAKFPSRNFAEAPGCEGRRKSDS